MKPTAHQPPTTPLPASGAEIVSGPHVGASVTAATPGISISNHPTHGWWQPGKTIHAQACFPAHHAGFQGHFPGKPVLPGFLQVQLVLDILKIFDPASELTAVSHAKFTHPVQPNDIMTVELEIRDGQNVAASLRVGNKLVSVMEIQLTSGTAFCASDFQKS